MALIPFKQKIDNVAFVGDNKLYHQWKAQQWGLGHNRPAQTSLMKGKCTDSKGTVYDPDYIDPETVYFPYGVGMISSLGLARVDIQDTSKIGTDHFTRVTTEHANFNGVNFAKSQEQFHEFEGGAKIIDKNQDPNFDTIFYYEDEKDLKDTDPLVELESEIIHYHLRHGKYSNNTVADEFIRLARKFQMNSYNHYGYLDFKDQHEIASNYTRDEIIVKLYALLHANTDLTERQMQTYLQRLLNSFHTDPNTDEDPEINWDMIKHTKLTSKLHKLFKTGDDASAFVRSEDAKKGIDNVATFYDAVIVPASYYMNPDEQHILDDVIMADSLNLVEDQFSSFNEGYHDILINLIGNFMLIRLNLPMTTGELDQQGVFGNQRLQTAMLPDETFANLYTQREHFGIEVFQLCKLYDGILLDYFNRSKSLNLVEEVERLNHESKFGELTAPIHDYFRRFREDIQEKTQMMRTYELHTSMENSDFGYTAWMRQFTNETFLSGEEFSLRGKNTTKSLAALMDYAKERFGAQFSGDKRMSLINDPKLEKYKPIRHPAIVEAYKPVYNDYKSQQTMPMMGSEKGTFGNTLASQQEATGQETRTQTESHVAPVIHSSDLPLAIMEMDNYLKSSRQSKKALDASQDIEMLSECAKHNIPPSDIEQVIGKLSPVKIALKYGIPREIATHLKSIYRKIKRRKAKQVSIGLIAPSKPDESSGINEHKQVAKVADYGGTINNFDYAGDIDNGDDNDEEFLDAK